MQHPAPQNLASTHTHSKRACPTLVPHLFDCTFGWALPCSHMQAPKSHAHEPHLSTHTSITPAQPAHAPARVSIVTLTPMAAGPLARPRHSAAIAVSCGSAAIRSFQRMAAARGGPRSGSRAAAPGLVLEASEAQELAHSGLLVLLQDQSR